MAIGASPPPLPPQPPIDPNAPQKSPLDLLEDILADAQKKDSAKAEEKVEAAKNEEQAKAAADQAATDAAIEAEKEKHRLEDEALLKQKQEELKTIVDTPEYQAKMAQEEAADKQEAEEFSAGQGFDITQLKHTKIQVDEPQQ